MRAERALLVVVVAWLAAACSGAPCIRHSDCDPGLVCSPAGACLVPADPDGGDEVDGAVDAAPDAGTDAIVDGGLDAPSPGDGGVDAPPPETLESEASSPIATELGLPHALVPVTRTTGGAP